MKNLLKMFFIMIMAFFLLGAGFYITLTNISKLLAAGKPDIQYRWLTSGLQIKTGKWSEKIDLPVPFQVTHRYYLWRIYNRHFTLTVNTKPKLRILWKKSPKGRRLSPNGEY